MRPARLGGKVLWLVSGLVLASAGAAGADVGAGIGASPIVLAHPATAGGSYRLPSLYVVNTGTEAAVYRVRVEQLSPARGRHVPASWVRFGNNDLALAAHQSSSVPMSLVVPPGAMPGRYSTDLVVGTVSTSDVPGAHVGAQAATQLQFEVVASTASPWSWLRWVLVALVAIGILTALVAVLRRSGLRLRIERRS